MRNSQPERRNAWLLLGWVVYFLLYYLTENLIPIEACHVIYCPLDDKIPFCEWFAFFYVGWYGLILFSLIWFLLHSARSFRNLQLYITITQGFATVIYLLYPSCQMLRPEVFPRENLGTAVMSALYRLDTNTCVFPSLHVAISIAIASVWLRESSAKRWIKALIVAFCVMVCLSVCFVKQHSVLDVLGAIPVCIAAEWIVFWRKAK